MDPRGHGDRVVHVIPSAEIGGRTSDVADVYGPLARLVDLRRRAEGCGGRPFLVGVTGPPAVGKSVAAALFGDALAARRSRPKVAVIGTDGFLFPNAVLRARGLTDRKGFPESFDAERFVRFLTDVADGRPRVAAPTYSHAAYDVLPTAEIVVSRPDVLVVEGLNVLWSTSGPGGDLPPARIRPNLSVYLDADESSVELWHARRTAAVRPGVAAGRAWRRINLVNWRENLTPVRPAANFVLYKGKDHRVVRITSQEARG